MGHRFADLSRQSTSLVQTTLNLWVSGVRLGRKPRHIHRLPPELLIEIMGYMPYYTKCARHHCQPIQLSDRSFDEEDNDERLSSPGSSYAPDTLSDCPADWQSRSGCFVYCPSGVYSWNWTEVLQVCKTWQAVCYACPEFWARLPFHDSKAVEKALELFRGRPLYLAYTMRNGQLFGIYPALERGSRRVRELVMGPGYKGKVGRSDAYAQLANKLQDYEAPSLQSFYFMSPHDLLWPSCAPFRKQPPTSLRHLCLANTSRRGPGQVTQLASRFKRVGEADHCNSLVSYYLPPYTMRQSRWSPMRGETCDSTV